MALPIVHIFSYWPLFELLWMLSVVEFLYFRREHLGQAHPSRMRWRTPSVHYCSGHLEPSFDIRCQCAICLFIRLQMLLWVGGDTGSETSGLPIVVDLFCYLGIEIDSGSRMKMAEFRMWQWLCVDLCCSITQVSADSISCMQSCLWTWKGFLSFLLLTFKIKLFIWLYW